MKRYNDSVKDDQNFKILFENYMMILGHVFEIAYVHDKILGHDHNIYRFNGDPTCGLIGKRNDWCLVGGDCLVLKTFYDNTIRSIGNLTSIHGLKLIDDYSAQILTDPWDEQSAIWQLDIDRENPARPVSVVKIKDFKEYRDKPYAENIVW